MILINILLGNSRNLIHLLVISLYTVCDLSLFPHGCESDVVEEVDEIGREPARPKDHHHRHAQPGKYNENINVQGDFVT